MDFGAVFCYNEMGTKKYAKSITMHQKGSTMKKLNTKTLGKYSRMILHIELPLGFGAALFFLFSYLKLFFSPNNMLIVKKKKIVR